MSIRYKLLLAFSVVVLLAAGVAGYGFQLISSTSALVIKVYDGPLMAVNYARSAQLRFAVARRVVEEALARREPASAKDLALVDESMKQLASDMGVVKERMASAVGFNDGIEKIMPLADDWYKAGMAYLKPAAAGATELPMPQLVIAKGRVVGETIDLVVENASAYGFNFRSTAEETAGDSKRNLIVLGGIAIIAGLLMAFVMAASFSRPIRHAMAVAEDIASGNFSVEIATKRRDELGRLLISLDKTRASLDDTVSGIINAANDVSTAAAEIATSTTDLSQRTEEQAAGLEKTAVSLNAISETVKKNADNAQRAKGFAQSMSKVADEGRAVVDNAVGAMAKIEDSSRKISDIIGVIDEIARQTNLLALNAAVEAARAGDAGRGFAVVASEVRNLAQRSAQAAKDVAGLIGNSSAQVKSGVELVNRTGGSLHAIVESIHQVSAIVAEIAETAGEQATGIEEVRQALHNLDEMTQQNSALVEENAATAKALDVQSVGMTERVAVFKLGQAKSADAPPLEQAA